MHVWTHKSVKPRNKKHNPSFSSNLLDEIYRSMDVIVAADKSGDLHLERVNIAAGGTAAEDEQIATLRRAFLVQKWIDMKANAKNFTTHRRKPSSLPEPDANNTNNMNPTDDGHLSTSRLRAFKLYSHIKKLNQPISPGARLTSFLNSLFATGNLKKPKDSKEKKIERISKRPVDDSTCSSASSFTRSCLSKNSPGSRERLNNGVRRTVRFYPVSVIIDQDCRPCGEKLVFGNGFDEHDDDSRSDTSSDLFEIDHLCVLKECDELPVYETTHFGTNCAIANGLIL